MFIECVYLQTGGQKKVKGDNAMSGQKNVTQHFNDAQ